MIVFVGGIGIEVLTIDGQDRQKDVSVYICIYKYTQYIYIISYIRYGIQKNMHISRTCIDPGV